MSQENATKTDTTEEAAFMRQEYQMVTDYLDRLTDSNDKSLERYIALVAATVGILLSVLQLAAPIAITWEYSAGILAIPLFAGWVWFMGNVTIDIYRRSALNHRQNLVRYFVTCYPQTEEYLVSDTTDPLSRRAYDPIATWRGMIYRALRFGGAKTILGIGNSLLAALIAYVITTGVGLRSTLFSLVVAALVFLAAVFIHLAYARARYRINQTLFPK